MSKRNTTIGFVLWVIASALPASAAGVQAEEQIAQSSVETAAAAREIQDINRRLLVRSKEDLERYTPDRVNRLTREIVARLTRYLLDELNRPNTPPPGILAERLRVIQGDLCLWKGTTDTPFVASSIVGSTPVRLMAYAINRGGSAAPNSKALLQVYQQEKERFVLAAVNGSEFDGHEYFVSLVPPLRRGEIWVLAYGARFGDSQSTLKVVLYSFDGKRLRALWEGPPFPHGEIHTTTTEIKVRYVDRKRYEKGQPPFSREQTYVFTEKGLEPKRDQAPPRVP